MPAARPLQLARTMRTAALILVATTTLAHAAPPEVVLGEAQLQLRPWSDVLAEGKQPARDQWVRYVGFAQLTGGGRAGGDAGAGAAVAVGGIKCELVAGTVHGRLRPLAEDGESMGQVTYSVCPFAALFTLKFDGHRGAGIAPGLDARRSLWNRAYTDVYDRMTLAFGPYWRDDGDPEHTIFTFQVGHGATTQSDGLTSRTTKNLDMDLVIYRFMDPRGFSADVLAFETAGIKAGADNLGGVASAFMPVRLHAEYADLYVNAQAGWGTTGGYIKGSGSTMVNEQTVSSWEETIDSAGLPDVTEWVGELEAGVRRDRFSASGRVVRGFYPTFDGNVARESRVTGNLTYAAGRTRRTTISLTPFATRTRTWVRDEGSSRDLSAGAQVHVGRELHKQLRIDAIGEAGVSPYARSESERLPTGNLGGQLMVAISGRVTELRR